MLWGAMKTFVGFIIQSLTMSFASASIFMASNIVMPLKAAAPHQESHIPRMSIKWDEFSPAFAALEDDYYVGDIEDEVIPAELAAEEIKPGTFEIRPNPSLQIELPQLAMSALQAPGTPDGFTKPWNEKKTRDANAEELQAQKNLTAVHNLNLPHLWIEGKIELTEGLAITDPRDELHVGWFVEGQKIRDGRVTISEGRYEIKVDRLEGEIIAELIDRKGFTIGEVILDLEDLAKKRAVTGVVIDNVDLRLKPYKFGAHGQTVAVYHSPTSRSPVGPTQVVFGDHDMKLTTKEDGKFAEEAVSAHSSALLAAHRGQYRESVVLADLEQEQLLRMFPDKYMDAMFEIAKVDKRIRDMGVIWGKVSNEEHPMAGYRARIAGHPETQTIYFSTYFPDQNRQATSTDGQFVFWGMLDGEYEIELLNAQGQKVDSKLVSVRAGAVSVSEFNVGLRKTLYVKPFDPFSQEPQSLQVRAMGSDHLYRTMTESTLKIPVGAGADPVLISTKTPHSQHETRTFASRQRKFQEVPMLNHEWWARVQRQHDIRVSSGVIVGFVDTENSFEVFYENPDSATKIIYFDQQGRTLKSNNGASGFIIYGAGAGLKTLILEAGTGLITTELTYVDTEAIALLYKNL